MAPITKQVLEDLVRKVMEETQGASSERQKQDIADAVQAALGSTGLGSEVVRVELTQPAEEPKREADPTALGKRMADLGLRTIGENPIHGTDFEKWGAESDDMRKRLGRPDEFSHGRTGLSAGTTTAGGYLVKTEEQLDPISIVAKDDPLLARCNQIAMETDSITLNLYGTDVTVSWTGESSNTASMATQATGLKPETQFALSQVTLNRYVAHVYVLATRKLLRTAPGRIQQLLSVKAPMAIRAAINKAILSGTNTAATDPINGLDNRISTNAITYNASNKLQTLLKLVLSPEISMPGVANTDYVVTSPRGIMWLMDLGYSDGKKIFADPVEDRTAGRIHGVPVIKDINCVDTYGSGSTDSRLYAGDFGNHCHFGVESSMFTLVDPYTYAKNNLVAFLFEIAAGFVPSDEGCFSYVDVPRIA